ncbi:hypothetical protein I1A62_36975 [Rhodococcus sp. USK10]|uniref:hypothetical protein n=1 Tax=Rhodococcus sp. USK10 TaxID=2789739 RepID=UPI001C5FFE4E|nr:hypothetical protein [Rhodococcus sp. USK10]QYB02731.1 hypothetical protein I1A62_36975 [Rhodococcus sp. USK10]
MGAHRPRYVRGSFEKHLEVGRGGDYKRVKVGAEFRTPAGRGVLVKGVAGYHGRPNRPLDITPTLDKPNRRLVVTAKPNASAGTRASTARKHPSNASAGRKVAR